MLMQLPVSNRALVQILLISKLASFTSPNILGPLSSVVPKVDPVVVVVVVVVLFYVHGKHLRSCRDGQLT